MATVAEISQRRIGRVGRTIELLDQMIAEETGSAKRPGSQVGRSIIAPEWSGAEIDGDSIVFKSFPAYLVTWRDLPQGDTYRQRRLDRGILSIRTYLQNHDGDYRQAWDYWSQFKEMILENLTGKGSWRQPLGIMRASVNSSSTATHVDDGAISYRLDLELVIA